MIWRKFSRRLKSPAFGDTPARPGFIRPKPRRQSRRVAFVEAPDGFTGRLADLWQLRTRRGRGGWLMFASSFAAMPLRLVGLVGEAARGSTRTVANEVRVGLRSDRAVHLIQGLPALAGLVAFIVLALAVAGRRPLLGEIYRVRAAAAFARERWQEADLCYQRRFRLDGGSAETRLFWGLTLERLGRSGEAEQLIRGVADGDAGGDPRANWWVASQLLAGDATFSDPARLRDLHRHLLAADRGLRNDHAVALGLAKYYIATGQPRLAIPKLASAVASDPALNLDLARLYAAVGQADSAQEALARGEADLRPRVVADPYDHQSRLLLASCVAAAGREAEAVRLLEQGAALDPNGPFRPVIARLYVAAYDRLAAQPTRNSKAMIAALREALRHDPKSADAAVRLVDFGEHPASASATDGADRTGDAAPVADAEATRLLEGLLAAGEQPPAVHMALGLKASRRGRTDAALWHFERAYDLDPSLAGVANNLAWTMAHADPPNLDRAMTLIGSVLERWPDEPHYLDTRGEVFRRRGQWKEALRDFEKALPSLRGNARLHRSLAETYERLGRPEIAAAHRREVERLTASDAAASTEEKGTESPPTD